MYDIEWFCQYNSGDFENKLVLIVTGQLLNRLNAILDTVRTRGKNEISIMPENVLDFPVKILTSPGMVRSNFHFVTHTLLYIFFYCRIVWKWIHPVMVKIYLKCGWVWRPSSGIYASATQLFLGHISSYAAAVFHWKVY